MLFQRKFLEILEKFYKILNEDLDEPSKLYGLFLIELQIYDDKFSKQSFMIHIKLMYYLLQIKNFMTRFTRKSFQFIKFNFISQFSQMFIK